MPLKKLFSALLALSLALCLCGCEEEEPKNAGVIPVLDSICAVGDTVYVLRRNDCITTEQTTKIQYELDAVTEDGTTNINVFPTGVRMVFHPSGQQLLCVMSDRLLSYSIKGETSAYRKVAEGAQLLCVTENSALLDDRTLVELNTAAIRTTEQLPSDSFRILDVLDDCIYYWHDTANSICRYDCAADTVSTIYSRERDPSVFLVAGKVWGDRFLYCEGIGLYAVPLTGEGDPELAIEKPTRIAAMSRAGEYLYLAAERMQDDLGFYRLDPDGSVTELGAWEDVNFYMTVSCRLSVSDSLLSCALTTGPEVFRLPLSVN